MKRNAFTLVEIMLVVMIVGALMLIAVPAWSRSRHSSRKVTCLNALRLISEAKEQWALQNNLSGEVVPEQDDIFPIYLRRLDNCPEGVEGYEIAAVNSPPICPNVGAYEDHELTTSD